MTASTRRIEQPITFKEVRVLACDGCGLDVDGQLRPMGWLRLSAEEEDGRGGIETKQLADFCTDCRPKIERAQKQEADAIKAEVIAAAADVSGAV